MATKQTRRQILKIKHIKQKRKKNKRALLIALGVVLLISLAIILPNLLRAKPNYKSSSTGFTLGNPDAPISVVNFSSFYCGYCELFSQTDEPEFIKNYVDTGDVFYRYVNLAFSNDEETLNAGKAAYCAAEQNLFFNMKPSFYSASREQDGFSISNIIRMAEAAGVDREQFEICLLENETLEKALSDDILFAQSIGLTGTPSFLVNDQLVFSNQLIPLVESLLEQ
ncbi:MAG: thioredoxin domain-containing protein [Chloroflexi bacterium]|nr:thioredoxin domain-containing protein [Chloroflexota bacterium]